MGNLAVFYKKITETRVRKLSFFVFFISAFIFFISLHPVSFFLGGLVFLLLGWILPTIAIFSLAVWITSFFVEKSWLIFLISIPIAFLLGINTYLPLLFERNLFEKKPSFHIDEKVSFNDKKTYDNYSKAYFVEPIFIPKRLYGPSFLAGGDEGCMCMYFEKSDDEFDKLFREYSSAPMNKDGSRPAGWTSEKNKNRIEFRLEKQSERLAKLTIEVFKEDNQTAWFQRTNIPLKRDFPVTSGRDEKLPWGGSFFVRAWDIFIHDNIFTWDGVLPNQYDFVENEARNFLNNAVSANSI